MSKEDRNLCTKQFNICRQGYIVFECKCKSYDRQASDEWF